MTSPTFAFLKPLHPGADPAMHAKILKVLGSNGFVVLLKDERVLDRAVLELHYAHHKNRDFFDPMLAYLSSGKSTLLCLDRVGGAVDSLRALSGPTDPKKGTRGLIRHDFGNHDGTLIYQNAIHASGTQEEAREEVERFFGEDAVERFFS